MRITLHMMDATAAAMAIAFAAAGAVACGTAVRATNGEEQELTVLRREIRELVGAAACDAATECRALPMGTKPCGGPWSYLVYSKTTTDSVGLGRLVSRYNAMEDSLNRREGLMSDCEHVQPPVPDCVDGRCTGVTTIRGGRS